MTKKEAIKQNSCETCKYAEGSPFCLQYCPYDAERKKEQEPCEDAISRQAALDVVCGNYEKDEWGESNFYKAINDLPSVTQKLGKWICIDDYHIGKFKCSVCQTEGFPNTVMYKPIWNYCPNCGAKMESEE